MHDNKNHKVWTDDFCSLLNNIDIIPTKNMSKNEKINAITRMILVVFIIMVIMKYRYSLIFLILALLILILYFINTKECYSKMDRPTRYRNPLIAQNSEAIKKMAIQPIITPRAHDREVWSYPSYRHSAVNYNQARYDITEDYSPVEQREDYKDYDPRLSSYTNFNLNNLGQVCNSQQFSHPPQQTNIEDVISHPPSQQPTKEMFSHPPRSSSHPRQYQPPPQYRLPKRKENFKSVPNTPTSIDNNFATVPDSGGEMSFVPNQDLLIPQTITSIYGPGAVTNQERIQYLTNIQPNEYSYSDVSYPINSNIGISYTPEVPPRVLDQVATPYGTYPLFHRIDPQLIRDENIPPERREELPRRTAWSAKYSMFDAAPGTVNFEDIYDPRFNGYGDEYRAYGDVNLGQVQYYYSDVDAYRYPNFGIRSKVDFIDYEDPMGRVLPQYDREVGVNDIKQTVHDQYTSDALYFREGLQERLMRKRNSELWQLRSHPMRKDSHVSSFTSHI
jgi:hypothetical protein